jgi:hypothetical protein
MQHQAETCNNCGTDSKCRRREFSDQAWSVLVLWNEVQAGAVDQAICEGCYDELREVLIDRADEIEAALNEPAPARHNKTDKAGKVAHAAPTRPAAVKPAAAPARNAKVRKAG